MKRELWFFRGLNCSIAAVVADGTIIDIARKRHDQLLLTGSQFSGKVIEKNSKLKALFVDIGLDRLGFLALTKDTNTITVGQNIIVRCNSEFSQLKGPALTFVSFNKESAQEPELLMDASDPVKALLCRNEKPQRVFCNHANLVDLLKSQLPEAGLISPFAKSEFVENWQQEICAYADHLDGSTWVFEESNGAFLLFEPGETLTAIDVNSGRSAVRDQNERLALNLSAVDAIIEQIELRQLSGQIVIDFLNLERKEARREVSQKFESSLAALPNRFELVPLNALGLLCLSRQRLFPAFHESSPMQDQSND